MVHHFTRSTSEVSAGRDGQTSPADHFDCDSFEVSDVNDRIVEAIRRVEDPEVPVTLFDLGVLRSIEVVGLDVLVLLRPTRLGCPGRERMEHDVITAVRRIDARYAVTVNWEDVAWNSAEVSAHGRDVLREFGFATNTQAVACPYCSSELVVREGDFGGALCKVPYTCRECGSTFDVMRSTTPSLNPVSVRVSAPMNRSAGFPPGGSIR